MDENCNECYGTGVINEFYVNHKAKKVASDWLYCPVCYPDSEGFFECPWISNYEIITLDKYDDYIKKGYKEVL